MKSNWLLASLVAVALCGCAGYEWTSGVPESMRTVLVPVFRNSSSVTELGMLTARQTAREFEREGTFKLARQDEAALEVQGEIIEATTTSGRADYRSGSRYLAQTMTARAKVSVIDKRNGRVLVDNREYVGQTEYASGEDLQTGMRDASGRVADDIARQIVDDVLRTRW